MRGSLLLFPLALALSCQDPDFNTPELLKNPRILAVQAEPPQPAFGQTATLRALIYQPPARTDAAECAGPDVGPKYEWSWCPLPRSGTNGYECMIEQGQMDQLALLLGLDQAPQLDLGTGETATLRNPFPAPLLYSLCTDQFPLPLSPSADGDAGSAFKFPCEYSVGDDRLGDDRTLKHPIAFPVTVMLKYTPPCGSPSQDNFGTPLKTMFTVRLSTDDTVPPDQNPTVGEILAFSGFNPDALVPDSAVPPSADAGASDDGGRAGAIDGGESEGIDGGTQVVDGGQPVPADAAEPLDPPSGSVPMETVPFPRQKRVGLWVRIPASSAEPLPRPSVSDEIAGKIHYFEEVNTVWFAEAGEFGGPHGSSSRRGGYLSPPGETTRPADENEKFEQYVRRTMWALPTHDDYPAPTAKVVVIVRDSRGGVAWASGVATLEDQP